MFPISSNLKLRVISAAILAPIVLSAVYAGGTSYEVLILLAAIIMSFEWNNIVSHTDKVSLDLKTRTYWDLGGIFYISIPCVCLLFLRNVEQGEMLIMWLLFSVWSTDVGAYFAGKIIGGPKLAPSISPNKTWAGLAGGTLAAVLTGFILGGIFNSSNVMLFGFFSMLLSIKAQGGDLFESWVKRYFGVKDSGAIIPGHGGVLDRVDGLLAAAPLLFLIWLFFSGFIL